MLPTILITTYFFLLGIVIGSFLNVLIFRIPKKENFITTRSHCMSCGYVLKWYDLVPLFSWIALGGKCRKCKARISVQYPLIEGLNGVLYAITFLMKGLTVETLLYCLLFSSLLALSVIDFRTYEIPVGFNYFILALGAVRLLADLSGWRTYLFGSLVVSGFLMILFYATHGRGIGGGDIKLMATCGLLLGWKLIILGFLLGCIIGSVIHLIRMKVSDAGRMLAMGPYLSIGVAISALWGERLIEAYLRFLGL
ncbi:MAG: prepilin peptidase [Lachnospiraceae bacterium]|nr:prepilin peptidase [Lachnospiraceae bacterium]